MDCMPPGSRRRHGLFQGRIVEERTVRDGFADPGELLIDNPAGTEIHMADFGIAHLAARQPHVRAGTGNQRVWPVVPQIVPHRRAGHCDCVSLGIFPVSPPVEHDENKW